MLKILNIVGTRPHFRILHFGMNPEKIKQTAFEALNQEFSEDKNSAALRPASGKTDL